MEIKDFKLDKQQSQVWLDKLKTNVCPSCGKVLPQDYIDAYQHQYGWVVPGYQTKLWLSIHCGYCNNDISLNKLGVHRR